MERRIDVRLEGLRGEVKAYCPSCDDPAPFGVGVPPTMETVLRAAEMAGLDPHREFRMLPHLALGYVEFWQVPTPLPERVPVPATAGVAP